ncbi:MAG: LamG-like jellyroll fold domain-containing protein, partial [Armatimonadota bacterium]
LRVPDDPALVMTDALTIDLWLMIDSADAGPQCIVDKRGERYRLQVSGTGVMFGLKSGGERMDLSGGELTPGRWHRVTGVFDRPDARLYVDGEEVANTTWDHPIGPGGDLFIGSKAGVTYFFGGQIDELRIYDRARPPRAGDAPSTDPVGATMTDAKLDVQELDDGMRVDTGAAVYELTDAGGLRALTIGGQAVMAGNEQPLMAASLLESAEYDGWRDHAPSEITDATWRPGEHAYLQNEDTFHAEYTGALDFGDGDTIDCELTLTAERGSPLLTARVALTREGDFEDRFIRDISLRLPLSLDRRKRVVQGGDRGIQWNTRHFYQFHVGPTQKLLNEPDHNIWRQFAIDQNSSTDYHAWKAESTATPALTMQRGEQAPGWMAAYDERAGLIFGYRDFAGRAPKSLRVDAEGSGEARVCLWHEGLPALAVGSPRAETVFEQPHTIDLGVFDDEFGFAQPDVALAAHWGLDGLASDPPNRNEVPLEGLNPIAEESAEDEAPLITGGVPLPRGALTDPANMRLQRDGAEVPVQTKAVGYWPDGSIMWLLLTFPPEGGQVTGAAGDGDAL